MACDSKEDVRERMGSTSWGEASTAAWSQSVGLYRVEVGLVDGKGQVEEVDVCPMAVLSVV